MTRGKAQNVCASIFKFAPQGKSGLVMSELLPHLSTQADEIAMIKSTYTEAINHDPGKTFFCTGAELPGKASMGAWLSYGLGSVNKDLPDFVVLTSAFWSGKVNVQALYTRLWGSGFLPSKHQGVVAGVLISALGIGARFASLKPSIDPPGRCDTHSTPHTGAR